MNQKTIKEFKRRAEHYEFARKKHSGNGEHHMANYFAGKGKAYEEIVEKMKEGGI